MSLCLRKLISVSTQLTLEGCRIIHDNLKHNSYTSYMKGEDNPVTSVPQSSHRQTTKSSPCLLKDSKCTSQTSKSSERKPKSIRGISNTTIINSTST